MYVLLIVIWPPWRSAAVYDCIKQITIILFHVKTKHSIKFLAGNVSNSGEKWRTECLNTISSVHCFLYFCNGSD